MPKEMGADGVAVQPGEPTGVPIERPERQRKQEHDAGREDVTPCRIAPGRERRTNAEHSDERRHIAQRPIEAWAA